MRPLSAAGAGCARVLRSVSLRQLLKEFPLLRRVARAVRTWKAGHFSFALVCYSSGAVLYSVLDISGDPACSPLGSTVGT